MGLLHTSTPKFAIEFYTETTLNWTPVLVTVDASV